MRYKTITSGIGYGILEVFGASHTGALLQIYNNGSSVSLLRDQVRELRDHLSTLLGETQISGEDLSKAVTTAWNAGVEAAAVRLEEVAGGEDVLVWAAGEARKAKLEVEK